MSLGPAHKQVPQVILLYSAACQRDRGRGSRSEIGQPVSGVSGRRPQVFAVGVSSARSRRSAGVAFCLLPLSLGQGKNLGKLSLVLETVCWKLVGC